jgi:NAD(P)-dependent dehydrogenase (short-subunit alcohol dehydrogenase family)
MPMTYPFPVSGDEFKGKRVLVIGGTKGMGQAVVRPFTLSRASVATTARSPLPDGEAVALFLRADIGTAAGVKDVISRIQQEWGGLDILVNNAGGSDAPNGG